MTITLSRNYWAARDAPFALTTTTDNVATSGLFLLMQYLINTASPVANSGARAGTSIASVLGSSNGTTGALDAVNRWPTQASLVRAAGGTAHSWIVLRLASLGYDICLDCIAPGGTAFGLVATPSSTPFTGGSNTTRPTSTLEFICGTISAPTTNTSAGIIGDTATGFSNTASFCCADNGEFIFLCSRPGAGGCTTFVSLWKTTGQQSGDTTNVMWICASAAVGGRGVPAVGQLGGAGAVSQRTQSGAMMTSGGIRSSQWGGTLYPGTFGGTGITGDFLDDPLQVRVCAPQVLERGILPDLSWIGIQGVGTSYPTMGAGQTHLVMGDLVIPFPVVVPTI